MEYRRFGDKIVLRVQRGEDIVEKMLELISLEKIRLAEVTGIGAAMETEMGAYDVDNKVYHKCTVKGIYEISSLLGNITTKDGEPYLHLHITIGETEKNEFYAGHLNRCIVGATAEIIVTVIDGEVERKYDDQTGLQLFSFKN